MQIITAWGLFSCNRGNGLKPAAPAARKQPRENSFSRPYDTSHYGKEGPWALPEGWCWTTLKEVCSIRGGKRIPKGKSFAKEKTAHVYIRVTDMKNMTVDMNDLKYIDDDVYGEISRYIIEKDDLYLTIAGTIGKVGEIPEELHGMNLTENAARLTDIACDKLYLMYALQTDVVQSHFSMRFHQVAQPKLSIETASSTLIALPPLFEQKRIVSAIQTLLTCIDSIEVEQHELDTNVENAKERILDLAIHGKLVSQDPSDEPAIELLKRINPDFVPSHNLHYEGNIPDGWTCGLFGELNQHRNKSEDPMSSPETEYELYSIPTYETGMPEYLHGKEIGSTKQLVKKGDVLLCKINPHLNRAWVVSHHRPELQCIASSEWIVFHSDAMIPEYARLFFVSPQFKNLMLSNVSGVGGSLMRAQPHAVKTYPIWIPPIEEQKRIVKMVTRLFAELQHITDFIES